MNVEHIKCFFLLAETLNYTKAAEILHKSQSVLSRQISALEEELGFSLFVRSSKSVKLTPAGAHMLQGLKKLQMSYRSLVDESQRLQRGLYGQLRFSIPLGEISGQFVGLFHHFDLSNPGIETTFALYDINTLCQHLNAPGGDSCDFTITVMTQPWFSHICRYIPNLNYIKLGIRSDCVYLPASHPLAQADAQMLTLKDFRDETFFVLKDFEVDVDDGPTVKAFAKHGFKPHLKSADSISELIINVEQNKGVCIGSNRLLLRDNPHFVKKYLPELGQHTEVLLWSEDNTNPCIRPFIVSAKQYLASRPELLERDPFVP